MKKQSDARQMFAHMLIMLTDPKRRDPRSREVCCTSITSRKVWHWQRGAFLDSGLSSQAAQVAHVARCCTMHGARQNRLCRALGLPLEPRQVFSSPPGLLPLLQCGSGRLMVQRVIYGGGVLHGGRRLKTLLKTFESYQKDIQLSSI